MTQRTHGRAAKPKHVILFLAANPSGTNVLALDREARAIREQLRHSGHRDRSQFECRGAVEPLDLLREIRALKPTVVHFSGHGGTEAEALAGSGHGREIIAARTPPSDDDEDAEPHGLYLQDAAGSAKFVSSEAISHTFGEAGASVQLVVLNACFTEPIAQALLAHVSCVVGMSGAIHDDAARNFAIGFYGGLGEHESIAAAYEQGRLAIRLDGQVDADRPQLKVRAGLDARQIILAATTPAARVELPCPYPGMRPYAADDAGGFHGRDAEIEEVLGRLRAGEREIYVIGPSGSGKSSLVRAGVLPRLARGAAGLGRFVVRALRPGEQPVARLAQALDAPADPAFDAPARIDALLAHHAAGTSVLILVDQLEELFTLASAEARAQVLAALRALRDDPRCVVLFTLRADFFGALMESPLWAERRGQLSRIEVGPLHVEALREAIVAPAREAGVTVEPELVERLLAHAASEPGILPLLQETLVQLWDARHDQTLSLADYEALGDGARSGLAVALARWADATLRRLTAPQIEIARRILLRLISFGEGRSDTRRQQRRSQLRTATDADDVSRVLQQMIGDRLLTIDEGAEDDDPTIDLAHEILISAWPTLGDWIDSRRVDEQRRRQLEAAAARWVAHGRGLRGLLDAGELAEAAHAQKADAAMAISADVVALIAASRAAHTQQRRLRWRLVAGAFAMVSTFAVIVTHLAITARQEAARAEAGERRARRQLAQTYVEAGRQLLAEGHDQEALPYLLEAHRRGEEGASLRMMFGAAARRLPLVRALDHPAPVLNAVFSGDGTRVLTASEDRIERAWEAATGRPIVGALRSEDAVLLAASPPGDARGDASRSDEIPPGTTSVLGARDRRIAWVLDAATGRFVVLRVAAAGLPSSARFSPDGRRVVTLHEDDTAWVWDAGSGLPVLGPLAHQDELNSARFSPDGTRVVTVSGDRTARIWDVVTGKLLAALQHRDQIVSAEFSRDGTRVITASRDKTARVWDAVTGKSLLAPFAHDERLLTAAFSKDGSRVVTVSAHAVRVWDVSLDDRTLDEWTAVAERSPFVLRDGAPVRRAVSVRGTTDSEPMSGSIHHKDVP